MVLTQKLNVQGTLPRVNNVVVFESFEKIDLTVFKWTTRLSQKKLFKYIASV